MTRTNAKRFHAAAAGLALLLPIIFLSSTVVAEVGGHAPTVAAVKRFIAYGLLLLTPAMAATGITGNLLAGKSRARAVIVKRKRTIAIAANGLLVLTPCALVLHLLASAGSFDLTFYVVQGVELIAGPINVALVGMNVLDGLRLSGQLPKPKARKQRG